MDNLINDLTHKSYSPSYKHYIRNAVMFWKSEALAQVTCLSAAYAGTEFSEKDFEQHLIYTIEDLVALTENEDICMMVPALEYAGYSEKALAAGFVREEADSMLKWPRAAYLEFVKDIFKQSMPSSAGRSYLNTLASKTL